MNQQNDARAHTHTGMVIVPKLKEVVTAEPGPNTRPRLTPQSGIQLR